ncbi:acyltransferase family protein [Hufsiella ginkgonis]|uniref:Acyltransferase family protein n=1 Tax=Hufsiella ginkgonis TaxID=2695274 RepID=A0A7K1Y2X0_9SPHI|nr:acyltransferase [Hufsiella ginkgonis]MXV17369.1 acyltransferase family protein [Hufsiella ginkgonis]
MTGSLRSPRQKLDSLVLLRGIAVMSVCVGHLAKATAAGDPAWPVFNLLAAYGGYGVQVFFVISGFVIPLSLHQGKYQLSDYPVFLYKRLLRLHPPYLLALAITLLVTFLSYRVRGVAFPETASSIIASLFYLHIPGDNPVFWSLAVEAQYYLFVGLFYVLLNKSPKVALFIALPLLVAACLAIGLRNGVTLAPYLIFFLVGILGFVIAENELPKKFTYPLLLALLGLCFLWQGGPAALATLFAIMVVLLYHGEVPAYLKFFGNISYSIYLIHFILGLKLISVLKQEAGTGYGLAIFTTTLVFVILVSWVFCRLIEDPSEKLSRQVKYKAQKKQA